MKKGIAGLGLVIFGVVTIIAIIGLVLLFTKAGTTGEASYAYNGILSQKAYVGQTGGMSADDAFLVIQGGRVEHIPQCYDQWKVPPSQYSLLNTAVTCYVIQDIAEDQGYKGRLTSNVYCYLNDIGYVGADGKPNLAWYDEANKVCIPDPEARRNPNGPNTY